MVVAGALSLLAIDSALLATEAPQTTPAGAVVPAGEVSLGSIQLPRQVMADGQTLPSGSYEVKVTASSANPEVPGQLAELERWAEFRQGAELRGREVVTIVPREEIDEVAKSTPPSSGTSRVEMLRENDYLRVWINQNETHYFIHLVIS
ncbi:MAG: hypothetical protein CL484_09565 [Acidobacteria bacterium]|nr:hypothetical protein [Acidobacteriota bacterium]|tara:strand:- start:3377 stop:3823 length:447 start_codon:yes stop_codon:yes gene_type:complete